MGHKMGYAWFRGVVPVSTNMENKNSALKIDTGAESAVFVDGRQAGAIDREHEYIYLNSSLKAGEKSKYSYTAMQNMAYGVYHRLGCAGSRNCSRS